jgi:hypothetical protein
MKKSKKIKQLFLNFSLLLLFFLLFPINIIAADQCQDDDDCPSGQYCEKFPNATSNVDNVCLPAPCQNDDDCPSGQYCLESNLDNVPNICAAITSTSDSSQENPQENEDPDNTYVSNINIIPQITIPGSSFIKGEKSEIKEGTSTIGEYIESIYNYLLLIVGIVAAIVLMVGGILWLSAGGNTERIGQAQKLITGSLTGLVLMLTSYILLVTINPNLVDFKIAGIDKIDPKIDPLETSKEYLCSWTTFTDAQEECGEIEGDTFNIGQALINSIISGEGELGAELSGLSKEEKMEIIKKERIIMCPPSKPTVHEEIIKCCCPSYVDNENLEPFLTDAMKLELKDIEKTL